jgi:regulator of replication initiation timing
MSDKLIELLVCEIKGLQKEVRVIADTVVNLRLENQELKAELHQLKEFFMPSNRSSVKFYTVLVTTIGGAMAGLIAIINNLTQK